MRFSTIFAISASSAVLGAPPTDLITGYLQTYSKMQKFFDLSFPPRVSFTTNDLTNVGVKLMNPNSLKDLLVDGVVSFNLTGLSVPEEEAEAAILAAAVATKDAVSNYFLTKLANKTDDSMIEDTKKEIRSSLKALSKLQNFELKAQSQIDTLLSRHPEYALTLKYTIMALPNVFKQVTDYVSLFFSIANQSDPELADKIVTLIEVNQAQYGLFPEDFYKKLQVAFKGDAY